MSEATPTASGVAAQPSDPLGTPKYVPRDPSLASLLSKASPGVGSVPEEVQAPEELAPTAPQAEPERPLKGNENSAWARARVLEREKKLRDREIESLKNQLDTVLKVVNERLVPEEPEESLEDLDPITRNERKQEKILEKLEALEEKETRSKEQLEFERVNAHADQQIYAFKAEADKAAPGAYDQAIKHLTNVWMSEELESSDDPEHVVIERVAQKAINLKFKYLKEGKNPGEEFFKKALNLGFDMNSLLPNAPAAAQAAPQAPKVSQTGEELIRKEIERRKASGSLSGVQGSPAVDTIRNLSKMSEKDQFRATLDLMKEKGSMRRAPSLKDLLAHKIVENAGRR